MVDDMSSRPHLCLVSDQLLPNLIPALIQHPSRVHLVVSEMMEDQGKRLRRLLEARDIAVTVHPQAPSSDMTALNQYVLDLAGTLEEQAPLVLNLTGGTKPMALAFAQWLPQLLACESIYTDTARGVIEHIGSSDGRVKPHDEPMADVIDLATHLAAYGARAGTPQSAAPEWRERAGRLKTLDKWLAEHAGELEGFLGALNGAVEGATKSADGFRARQPLEARGRLQREALERIAGEDHGLLRIVSDTTVEFADEDAARHLGGLWLEHYAWHVLRDAGLTGAACGQTIYWKDDRKDAPRNELDVVAAHRNRLLLIECKTARFGRSEQKDQDIAHKLEALGRNAGGLFGTTVLLSARCLSDDIRRRAVGYRIRWFDPTNLKDFPGFVRTWAAPGQVG